MALNFGSFVRSKYFFKEKNKDSFELKGCPISSLQFLSFNVFKANFTINPNIGNVSYIAGNATNFGQVKFWYFKNIPNYEIPTSIVTASGNEIMSKTIKPCDEKSTRRIKILIQKLFGAMWKTFEKENLYMATRMPCPLEKVFFISFISWTIPKLF